MLKVSPILHSYRETEKLRSSLIVFMSNKIESYSNLSTDVLNADLPPQFHCETVMDRIMLSAKADSCVGELEIIATAEMTSKTIMVVNKKYEVIRVYNNVPDRLRQDLIILMFIDLSDTTGHFEPVVVTVETSNPLNPPIENTCIRMFNDENESLVSAKEILPIPRKSPKVATRKQRCQVATVLTASPHKKHLEGKAMTKKATCLKTKSSKTRRLKQRKQKPKNESSKPSEDWSCMICGENIKESMTQCIGCGR
ncbi:hypothetical protein SNE40_004776 [Patella caerulea]|uniref:Uncharacterized protein n=1 Tax=Patella caerulea TaxID=87958 RepID=A0AAN8Q1C7_PATCE